MVLGFFSVLIGYFLMVSSLFMHSCSVLEVVLCVVSSCEVGASFLVDEVSVIFSGVVLVIFGSVSIYSKWYMNDEVFYRRFIILIYLFVGSMIMLIFSSNLVGLMVGWDGLGLVSFLLVCYYQNSSSMGAAMLTVLVNRVGDVFILASIGLMSMWGEFMVYDRFLFESLGYVSFFIILAGMTKSAQMPFCSWLPAAMAAPTPVSSLVHSSTLVTAGVYLIIRCVSLCGLLEVGMEFLKFMSLLTLVMAGMAGLLESDFKKVIALSTLSQLSVMMFSLSLGLYSLAFFHLVTHATFKALLFLSAGAVIHSNKGCQDLRLLGGMWMNLPVSSAVMVVASFSLCGVPFMSGFISKDLIIELSLMNGMDIWFYFFMLLGIMFTSWYSVRVIMSVVFGLNKCVVSSIKISEPLDVIFSYFCLYFGAVFSGYLMVEKMGILVYQSFVDSSFFFFLLFLPFYGGIWFIFSTFLKKTYWFSKIVWFIVSMWNYKFLSAQLPSGSLFVCGNYLVRCMDLGWLEKVGPQGSYELLGKLSKSNQVFQSKYFLSLVLFSVVMVIVMISLVSLCYAS
uniref:NADH-ubiquinone oxidoreductase chain 5 n=1 Tax=Mytilisepta keenae TaxID=2590091 RepID=A0A516EZC5_9BIVA|nr:NADH dehydrogenase subunit 5 [Mytilisepta keenae]QDO71854.1 NADH dehydrogenase subunit 5 [Mytilisepta keenae]